MLIKNLGSYRRKIGRDPDQELYLSRKRKKPPEILLEKSLIGVFCTITYKEAKVKKK
jgi:hypothetical protein